MVSCRAFFQILSLQNLWGFIIFFFAVLFNKEINDQSHTSED